MLQMTCWSDVRVVDFSVAWFWRTLFYPSSKRCSPKRWYKHLRPKNIQPQDDSSRDLLEALRDIVWTVLRWEFCYPSFWWWSNSGNLGANWDKLRPFNPRLLCRSHELVGILNPWTISAIWKKYMTHIKGILKAFSACLPTHTNSSIDIKQWWFGEGLFWQMEKVQAKG